MRDSRESPAFVKLFEFLAWLLPLTVKFPREQRFVVAQALQRAALAAHESLIRAGMSANVEATLAHLDEVATQLALVRFYIRLSARMGLMTAQQYEYAAERLSEVARLVQAWRNARRNSTASLRSSGPPSPVGEGAGG